MSDYYSQSLTDLPLFAAPAVRSSPTSVAAARSLSADTVTGLKRSVVAFLRKRGDHGATDEEMQAGIPMPASTQRPRRIELVKLGLVVEAGSRKTASGRYAVAWRLA